MTSRRDWQLQQLGITQWSLRRPGALQGEIAISLPEHIRLVMVAETPPSLTEPLIGDILRALAAVSYTHLDVYKRQELRHAFWFNANRAMDGSRCG